VGELRSDGDPRRRMARDLVVRPALRPPLTRAWLHASALTLCGALLFAFTGLSATPQASLKRESSLIQWLKASLNARDPWARFATRARVLLWSDQLSEDQQAELLALGRERGESLELQRWLRTSLALTASRPELPSLTQALGFLKDPWVNAGTIQPSDPLEERGWAHLPAQLRDQGLYPVTPWGDAGYYALWPLQSPREQALTLCLSHTADLHVWLNGDSLGSIARNSSLWLDQSCWELPFREGVNQLVVHATGGGLWGARISGSRRRPSLEETAPPWGVAQAGLTARPRPLEDPRWEELTALVDRSTELGPRGRALLSDQGLLGVALYASLAEVPEAQRLSPVIEAHLRWERSPSLTMSEALEALTPPELRAQSWADYPPPDLPLVGVSGQRALRLWLSCARDHLREGRFSEARTAINRARELYPTLPLWGIEEAQLLTELGLTHSAYQVSVTAFKDSAGYLTRAERGALGRQLLRLLWSSGAHKEAAQLALLLSSAEQGGAPRVARAWLALSLELTEPELRALGGAELVALSERAKTIGARGPYAWSTPLLATELSIERGHWQEAQRWLSSPALQDLPSAELLRAQVFKLLGDHQEALRVAQRARELAPQHAGVLDMLSALSSTTQGDEPKGGPTYAPILGPPLEELLAQSPWGSAEGDRDPPPVRVLYDHTHLEIDPEGRLIRQRRVALEVLKPQSADAWRVVRVPHRPALETLTLGNLARVRSGAKTAPKVTHEGLSDDEARVYYDAVVEVIDFGSLQAGDLLTWEWSAQERSPDREGVRVHGSLIPLQSRAPTALKRLTLGPNARGRLHIVAEPRGLWLKRNADGLEIRGAPGVQLERSGLRGASAVSYAHVSVLSDWSSIADLYRETISPLLTPSQHIKATARRWTQGVKGTEEQLRALYHQVTQRVRYVGLEFGRHSFTPASPDETLSRGFGDCKDRAALMIALGDAIGVELQFVMVRTASAGRVEVKGAASLGAFNHAALYSPELGRFLDPTVAHYDPWVLPADDQGAQALVVPSLHTTRPAELVIIPYQDSALHLERLTLRRADQAGQATEVEASATLRWERSGVGAAEAREELERARGASAHTATTLARLTPGLSAQRLSAPRLSGVSPAVDPLTLVGRLTGSDAQLRSTAHQALHTWSPLTRLAPTATRRGPWRQLPEAYELCVPREWSSPLIPAPPPSPHATLRFSARQGLTCASIELTSGELSPASYLERRAWLIEAERALNLWLPEAVEER